MAKKVVLCNCGGGLVSTEAMEQLTSLLRTEGIGFTMVSDLCGVCATKKDEVAPIFSSTDDILVVACYARAVKLMLQGIAVDSSSKRFSFLNVRDSSTEELLQQIRAYFKGASTMSGFTEIKTNTDWPAWYPVIDYSRCTTCGQCADFCLFGVYEKQSGKVFVVNPQGCKNNCPACARICPQTAIIFPKYEHGGAIAGAESINEIDEQQRQQHDIDSILGSDIYKALEMRKAKRKSIVNNEAMRRALEERDRALQPPSNVSFADPFGIPPKGEG